MSAAFLAALLAAAAVGCLALPRDGVLRLEQLARQASAAAAPTSSPGRPGGQGVGWRSARAGSGRCRSSARASPTATAVLALGVAVGLLVGVIPGLLAGGAGGLLLRRRTAVRAAAAHRLERRRMVEACATLAAELRSGRAPADALSAAAELATGASGRALAAAAAAARLGGDVAAALAPGRELGPRRASGSGRASESGVSAAPEVQRALAACWTVCAGTGSGLAAAVERLEEGLRADAAQRRAVDAELAGPRATAGLLAVLPAAGILLASGLGADPLHVLLFTPLGLVCLTLGLSLDALGLWWTRAMVARAGSRG